jgi:hypothetical protein
LRVFRGIFVWQKNPGVCEATLLRRVDAGFPDSTAIEYFERATFEKTRAFRIDPETTRLRAGQQRVLATEWNWLGCEQTLVEV